MKALDSHFEMKIFPYPLKQTSSWRKLTGVAEPTLSMSTLMRKNMGKFWILEESTIQKMQVIQQGKGNKCTGFYTRCQWKNQSSGTLTSTQCLKSKIWDQEPEGLIQNAESDTPDVLKTWGKEDSQWDIKPRI